MKLISAILEGFDFLPFYSLDSYDEKKPIGFLISLCGQPDVVQSYFSCIHNWLILNISFFYNNLINLNMREFFKINQ